MARGGGGAGEPDAAFEQRGIAAAVVDRIIDLLDASDDLRTQPARRILRRRVTRLTCHDIHLPDFELSRDWVIAFVEGCAELDGGLSALVDAIAFQRPDSSLLQDLRRLVAGVDTGRAETVATAARLSAPTPLTDPEPLTPQEIAELARVFTDRLAVTSLLTRAGIPPARIPEWGGRDPAAYWREVSGLLSVGLLVDGRRRVLAVAAEDLPANPVFTGRGPA